MVINVYLYAIYICFLKSACICVSLCINTRVCGYLDVWMRVSQCQCGCISRSVYLFDLVSDFDYVFDFGFAFVFVFDFDFDF